MKAPDLVLFSWLLIFSVSCSAGGQKQEKHTKNRPAVVAGAFYPADPDVLKNTLEGYFRAAPSVDGPGEILSIIVPHAGYVYSGAVAASAYKQLDREKKYDHVFIIGPSHYAGFPGASVYNQGNYETPLGTVEVDTRLATQLIRDSRVFFFNEAAHAREHCIEVQLPFLQYWLKKPFQLVPVVIGTQDPEMIRIIADQLKPWFREGNLFIISSDMSHYPDYQDAIAADHRTIRALVKNDPGKFLKALGENASAHYKNLVTSMCGAAAVMTLLDITHNMEGVSYRNILYRNSGDVPEGDKTRVVGYGSFVITKQTKPNTMGQEYLSEKEKKTLLKFARNVLNERIKKGKIPEVDVSDYSETLRKPAGAFVTLTENGQLRGCIGRFEPGEPLVEVVRDMTISAALRDPRFPPVRPAEVDDIDIEISVLTPLKKISSPDEFILGKHGIYMVKDGRSGTFLPQVAESTGWTKEEFLGHCARDKAGIGWDGWKDADLYVYEAIIFSEKEFGMYP